MELLRKHLGVMGICFLLSACLASPKAPPGCVLAALPKPTAELWPAPTQGNLVCPRPLALLPADTTATNLLTADRASVFQTHCSEMFISFEAPDPSLSLASAHTEVVEVKYIAHGAGMYTITPAPVTCVENLRDGTYTLPPGQPPMAAHAYRQGMSGTGVLSVNSDTHLDAQWTTGSLDVAFPDGTRLLVDFEAPLTATE